MTLPTFGLILLISSTIAYGQNRSPAVEDFVGIEVEENQITPHGSESLYNLEQDIKIIQAQENKPAPKPAKAPREIIPPLAPTLLGIFFALGLPLAVWLLLMSRLKKKASIESASNIEVLEKFRQEREKRISAGESKKKAS
jgi:hypothetical protein